MSIAVTLLAAGCAGSAGTSPDEEAAAVDETPMAASSPIGAFFAEDGGFEAAFNEYNAIVNEEIVRCMASEGFEFKPDLAAADDPVDEAQNELSEREWTTQYGYGISTSFETLVESRQDNPNGEILRSMSFDEIDAWLDTLMGEEREGFEVDIGGRPLETQGCIGNSIIATGGADAVDGFNEFGDVYEEGEAAIFDRTEMIGAVDGWSQCMAEAGYTGYATIDAPEDDIGEKLDVITAPIAAAFDDLDPDEARAVFTGDADGLDAVPGLDIDALRDLQAEERQVALVDLDCYDAHVRSTYEPLRDDFENGLLDTYSDQFNALKTLGQ